MKELSIKDKAKRYDKAIEKAEKWHNAPNVDKIPTFGNRIIEDIFPELHESEDERIKNEIIDYISTADDKELIPYESWIAWLEKQGEQNPAEWHIEDEQNLNACLGYIPDEFLKRWLKDIIHIKYDKPINKAESKFHEGDFIKHNKANIICKVISVNRGIYYVENIELSGGIELFNAEQNFHLWSIEDAKDGDVLATDKGVFIYAKLLYNKPYAYCGVDKFGVFKDNCLNNNWTNSVDNIYPATKEQRDLLFANIHEAGYEWNFDKRELTKE